VPLPAAEARQQDRLAAAAHPRGRGRRRTRRRRALSRESDKLIFNMNSIK
jgi:hypothetical protein